MTSAKAIRWAFICLLALFAVLWAVNAANNVLSYIPFTSQWNERRAAAKVPGLEAEVSRLTREAQGNAEIGQAVERHYEREVIVREVTAQAINDARNAPDADTPLSSERAGRLRSHDASVCSTAPVICSTIGASGSRAGAVPPDGPSGQSDAG